MMVEEGAAVEKLPDLNLLQLRFLLSQGPSVCSDAERSAAKSALLGAITKDRQALLYDAVCAQFGWERDDALAQRMRAQNDDALRELDAKIKDAEENLGESEIREALLARANFFSRIGEKDKAVAAFAKAMEKSVALGHKLDIVFTQIRLGFFHGDNDLVVRNIDKAGALLEQGGDWDRKNRLKCYKGIQALIHRDFTEAANQFLDTISTFSAYELFDYVTLVKYTVITAVATLPRVQFIEKLIDSPEILSVIDQLPHLRQLTTSLYNSDYSQFLVALLSTINTMRTDWLLSAHSLYFCREMRVRAYSQMLESYRSVQLSSMALAFGVSPDFLDRELSRFISLGRLNCVIDKVAGIVETNRPDSRNAMYQSTIKTGDALLNRVHKLSRVICS
ncbi:26S proteasome non-ATPase regulatory subunit 6 [Pelomyxa schiedti]|nr:26S proteasome non-ATPase regulatory subunit 6 [Pelomyxa schiedti]